MVINLDDKKILSIKYLNDNGTVTYFNFKNGVFQDAETVDENKVEKEVSDLEKWNKSNKPLDKLTADVLNKSRELTDYALKNNIYHVSKEEIKPLDAATIKAATEMTKHITDKPKLKEYVEKAKHIVDKCPPVSSKTESFYYDKENDKISIEK